jgi:hypothetical protein
LKPKKPITVHAASIEMFPVGDLLAYESNARLHPEEQLVALVKIIQDSGFTNPLLIDDDNVIIAGHGRLQAAQRLKMAEVPCVRVSGLSPAQIKALRLSDNKIGLLSGWDDALLRIDLGDLQAIGFDMSLTGFGDLDLAEIFGDDRSPHGDPEEVPEVPVDPTSRAGDIWLCRQHRVMCGNSLDRSDVDKLTLGDVPGFANCDPPYGIKIVKPAAGKVRASDGGAKAFGSIGGHQHAAKNDLSRRARVHGLGKSGNLSQGAGHVIKTGLYAPIIGDETVETAVAAYELLLALKVPKIILWGGNYYADRIPASRCWLVWDKENSGSFADAELAWTNQDAVVKVFRHQWNGLIKASERGEKRVHPTQKPVALAQWVRETVAPDEKTVIDLFLGGGAVLIDAERAGIQCFGMEMSPAYVDVALLRWAKFTGQEVTHEDGRAFSVVKAERQSEEGI